jgi:hypothetical protein
MNKWVSHKGDILTEPCNVEGYNSLDINNKKIFEAFLKRYYKYWEYPENHMPIKVVYMSKEKYLKVLFNDTWLHVVDAYTWY